MRPPAMRRINRHAQADEQTAQGRRTTPPCLWTEDSQGGRHSTETPARHPHYCVIERGNCRGSRSLTGGRERERETNSTALHAPAKLRAVGRQGLGLPAIVPPAAAGGSPLSKRKGRAARGAGPSVHRACFHAPLLSFFPSGLFINVATGCMRFCARVALPLHFFVLLLKIAPSGQREKRARCVRHVLRRVLYQSGRPPALLSIAAWTSRVLPPCSCLRAGRR